MRLILFLALRQLWARKLLNGIAIVGVALGVLVLISLNAIMQGFQMKFKGEMLKVAPHVVVTDKELGSDKTLLEMSFPESAANQSLVQGIIHQQPNDRYTQIKRPNDWVAALEALPEVEAACAGLRGQAILSLGTKVLSIEMMGVNPDKQDKCTPITPYIKNQHTFHELAVNQDGVIIGSGVAESLGAKLDDRIRLTSPDSKGLQVLKVIGIFESEIPPIDKTRIYVNLTKAQSLLAKPNMIGRIDIRLKDPLASFAFNQRLEKWMHYDGDSWQETNKNFLDLFNMQNMIIALVIGAIMTVGGFGILSIQIMIVLQKIKDISILRSVGLRRKDILLMFLIQGIIIALIGAIVGNLLGWRLVEFLGALKVKQEGLVKSNTFLVYKDPWFYWLGGIFSMVTGVLASLLPAWRASQVEPVDVLRGQV